MAPIVAYAGRAPPVGSSRAVQPRSATPDQRDVDEVRPVQRKDACEVEPRCGRNAQGFPSFSAWSLTARSRGGSGPSDGVQGLPSWPNGLPRRHATGFRSQLRGRARRAGDCQHPHRHHRSPFLPLKPSPTGGSYLSQGTVLSRCTSCRAVGGWRYCRTTLGAQPECCRCRAYWTASGPRASSASGGTHDVVNRVLVLEHHQVWVAVPLLDPRAPELVGHLHWIEEPSVPVVNCLLANSYQVLIVNGPRAIEGRPYAALVVRVHLVVEHVLAACQFGDVVLFSELDHIGLDFVDGEDHVGLCPVDVRLAVTDLHRLVEQGFRSHHP